MRFNGLRRRGALIAAALALAVPGAVGVASAGTRADTASPAAPAPAPAAAAAVTSTRCFESVSLTSVASTSTQTITSVGAFANLDGATAVVDIPAGQSQDCLVVTFSAETVCSGITAGACHVRVLDNGTRMTPADNFLHWDAPNREASSYQWIRRVDAGRHTIQVQVATTSTLTSFSLDDWLLNVEHRE